MHHVDTDPKNKPLRARTDDASTISKDAIWPLFTRVDKLLALKAYTHRHYVETAKTQQKAYYVKMSRLEKDIEKFQGAIKALVGSNDVRPLRREYDESHAPADSTERDVQAVAPERIEDPVLVEETHPDNGTSSDPFP